MNSDAFNFLISKYTQNKDNEWKDWLEYDKTFDKHGKQGMVGTLKVKSKNPQSVVFKLSQYINNLVEHEYTVMDGLKELSGYCPHFCKSVGIINTLIEPTKRKKGNPFKITSKYPIEKNVLLCEMIEGSKLSNYIKSEKIPDKVIYSLIKQVILAIIIAQNKKKFTHYDLHSNNIMIKKCNKEMVFLYVIDKDNKFCVPTHGYYPVIIDFGFSYIEDMDNGPLWMSLAHTSVGFMSDRFDWIADPKLFLITVAEEMKIKRKNKKLQRVVKNIFYPLSVEWDSGWDDFERTDAADFTMEFIMDELEKEDKSPEKSQLFEEIPHHCIDLLQTLIILPLEKQNYSQVAKSYMTFINEWVKIEREFINSFYTLYILKNLIDCARLVRPEYNNKSTMNLAVKKFRDGVFEAFGKVSKFCNPRDINYELMLCSLLVLSRCIEGILYEFMQKQMTKKYKQYKKLPVKSIQEIFNVLDVNFDDDYEYTNDTKICIFNSLSGETDLYEPTEEIANEINKIDRLTRGTVVHNIL